MPAMEIRDRTVEDLKACAAIARIVRDRDGYPPRLPHDLVGFVTVPAACSAWVAVDAGVVVGQVVLNPTSSPPVMAVAAAATGAPPGGLVVVARLLVAPEARRRGVGRRLLLAATEGAHRLGRRPVLDVATHYAGAVALYEACGWRRGGEVDVRIGSGRPLREYVYVGPAPPVSG